MTELWIIKVLWKKASGCLLSLGFLSFCENIQNSQLGKQEIELPGLKVIKKLFFSAFFRTWSDEENCSSCHSTWTQNDHHSSHPCCNMNFLHLLSRAGFYSSHPLNVVLAAGLVFKDGTLANVAWGKVWKVLHVQPCPFFPPFESPLGEETRTSLLGDERLLSGQPAPVDSPPCSQHRGGAILVPPAPVTTRPCEK